MITKKETQVPAMKAIMVPDGTFRTETTYVTSDGKEWVYRELAERHERTLTEAALIKGILTKDVDVFGAFPEAEPIWYYLKTAQDVENWKAFVLRHYARESHVHGIDRVIPGDWYCYEHYSGGDYADTCTIHKASDLIVPMQEFIKSFSGPPTEEIPSE